MTECPKVRVACRIPNGVMIRLSKPGYDDGTGDGVRPTVHDGPGIRLNGPSSLHTGAGATAGDHLLPEFTEVDEEWMGQWLEQHKLDPLVTMEKVFIADADGKPKGKNPTA